MTVKKHVRPVLTLNERPLAAEGLQSYRYTGPHGFVMIGAHDDDDALREAVRSVSGAVVSRDRLEVWDAQARRYVRASFPRALEMGEEIEDIKRGMQP